MQLLHTTETKYPKMCSTFPNYAATSPNINWEMSHWDGLLFHKALEHTHSSLCHPLSFDMSVHWFLMS